MNKLLKISILVILNLGFFAQAKAQDAKAIVGKWLVKDQDTKVEIYAQNGKYFGKIVWEKDPKNQEFVGKILIKNLVFEKGFWQKGEILDPDTSKFYPCELKLVNNQKNLRLKAFWGILSFSEDWTKTN
ncbi:MAG: DUF2147 domain-containing protein [Microscillaceae bacterium]|jgi:uncharacterized protein (DUF2147 family)|nr:DUF2147 domain-containing protein [Microscillaceae bacterium]